MIPNPGLNPRLFLERDLGEQPIKALMEGAGLRPHDLVAASKVPMTHKMVSRACKGRRLTANTKKIVRDAFNTASASQVGLEDLFNY